MARACTTNRPYHRVRAPSPPFLSCCRDASVEDRRGVRLTTGPNGLANPSITPTRVEHT